MSEFYIKADEEDCFVKNSSGDTQWNVASFSNDNVVVISPKTEAPEGHMEIELFHKELGQSLKIQANVIDQVKTIKTPRNFRAFKLKLIYIDQQIRKTWEKFFEQKLLTLNAEDIMTCNILTCNENDKVKTVLEKINNISVGSILVTNDKGTLKGIFTERDVLTKCTDKGFFKEPVKNYMTKRPVTIPHTASAEEIYQQFNASRFRHLPILKDKELVGMISIRDLIRYWTKLLEVQKASITRDYERAMGVIVHDLRSPIYAIRAINELLNDGMETPEGFLEQGFPKMIDESCGSMIELIDDLLKVSEVKSGHIQLDLKPHNISDIISQAVNTFKPSADAKGIDLNLYLKNVPVANLDAKRFTQVVQNLVSNAIKYSEPNSQVEIELEQVGCEIIFSVVDHGQGIQPDELSKVFDEMCKISSQPTANEPSTGLGLSIAKKLIEAHGGSVKATSEPGKETRFEVRLPGVEKLSVAA